MTSNENADAGRALPRFFTEWRALFGDDAADFTPIDYLNQQEGLPFVIAAQWLFCPTFTKYRDCVVIVKDLDGGLSDGEKKVIDDWLEVFDGDTSKTETKKNLLILSDIFTSFDTEPYEEDLSRLARTLARCWQGLLKLEYPERDLVVEVYDDEWSYGPEVTFYTRPSSS
ncbi:MAG: hypothetical protein GEV03_23760 [Streptosporangiales bacterium]|nr:hypothetical protein [Streptosporangiales bacterium]